MQKNKFRKGLVIAVIVLFIGASVVPSTCSNIHKKVENPSPLGSGLVAYWNFDEGTGNILHDVSGNGNDGTIYGAQWVNGTPGYGLDFDGVDDYVELPPISQITNIPINQISLAGWIYLRTTSGPEQFMEAHTTTHEILLEKYADSSAITFDIVDDDGGIHSVSTSTLSLNNWHFIVGTYNGTTHCIYVDGVLENTSSWSNTFTITTGFTLAKDYEQSGQFLDGILDEVRIYEKSLNSSDVEYLYNNSGVGDTVYVDDDFDENTTGWQIDHFDKIQDGVDAVNENGTVYVYNGTYYENVVIDKIINLVGEDRNSTIIDAGGSGDVVYVSVNWVNVSGFTIRNSGSAGYPNYDAGVEIRSNYSTIIGNIVTGNNRGVWISANNNSVLDNEIISNNAQGIEIYLSRDNTIAGNNVSSNTKAGIQSDDSSNNIIISNTITSNSWHGVFLDDSSNSNTIISNNISDNDIGVCIFDFSDSNIIYHNNLINNTQNAYDECSNTWNSGYPSGGNYWDDYTGEDNDGDGIGDTPYNISGGSNQDLYPLMHPWGENPPVADFSYSIDGPTVQFDGSLSYDRDGEIISYEWDFDDGTNGTGMAVNHTYSQSGTFNVTLTVTDDDGYQDNVTKSIEITNLSPGAPIINGQANGKTGVEYEYTFNSTDPDDDPVMYLIDWGDNNTDWTEYCDSGDEIMLKHTWDEQGDFTIKAKAKDIFDAESEWGTLEVTMPKNKPFNFNYPFLSWLFERFPNAFPILRQLFGL